MVRGFFPAAEQETVLVALEDSVIFLTPENIESVILKPAWMHTAWVLGNLYLENLGAPLLGPDEETTCYIAPMYFHEKDRFADFLVHEAAHLFHNCRRRTIGLPETRTNPWPLKIDFRKREIFAYACEFYSRMLTLSSGANDRRRLFADFRAHFKMTADGLDRVELLSILEEAVNARNGWKRILALCSEGRKKP